ncbi:hypothetical protein SLEP1_g31501 [Rubroshorea leprosula]|uniref:Pectate lyase n=1 Tax=Rubroshorea leprosula TaxID=152421 RepID=A0AAV5K9Y2_9ROSI|nr:hypothetical protein SLEP1_g31501 [Rubroshorea leprosula]
MINNIGKGVVHYKVTNPSDDPLNPKPGSLRYGATMVKGKVWITFKRDMQITLHKPLLISSFTAIDNRGVDVHFSILASFLVHKHCKRQSASSMMGPEGKVVELGQMDGDAIRLVSATKVWIDHNTLHDCEDGLLDVTRGSTDVTISNNWFRNQDKVMLLGHDDGYVRDKGIKATVVFNHFGPNCNKRMPRVRHGFAHSYQGWEQYAIGGSLSPSIISEANCFIAPEGNKEVTSRLLFTVLRDT